MIKPDKTRVALVLFSNRVTTVFSLDTYNSQASVIKATQAVRYPRGGTKIGAALRVVATSVLEKARKEVSKVRNKWQC